MIIFLVFPWFLLFCRLSSQSLNIFSEVRPVGGLCSPLIPFH